jgi:hypothetical protein
MSYRGIENIYGNLLTFVDGLNVDVSNVPWVADHGFVSDTFVAPYTTTGFAAVNATGYISDIATNATYDYGFLPLAVAGSSTTKLCDMFSQANDAGWTHVYNFGGYISSGNGGADGGMFNSRFSNISSASFSVIGARLMYIG